MSETPSKKGKRNSYKKKKASFAPKHAEAVAEAFVEVDNARTPGDAERRVRKRGGSHADDGDHAEFDDDAVSKRRVLFDLFDHTPTWRFLGDRSTPPSRPVGRRIICDSHYGLFDLGDPFYYSDHWKIRNYGTNPRLQVFGTGAVPDLHTHNSAKINLQSLQLQGRVFLDTGGGDLNYFGARDIHCSLFVVYDRSGFNIINGGTVPNFKDVYQIYWTHVLGGGADDVIAEGNNCFLLNAAHTDRFRVLRRIDFVLEWRERFLVPHFRSNGEVGVEGVVGVQETVLVAEGTRYTVPEPGYETWNNNMLLKNRQRPISEFIDLQGLPSTYDPNYAGPSVNWALPLTGQVFLAAYASIPPDMPEEFGVAFEMVARLTATVKD